MNLNLRTFSQLVQDMGAALQGSATNIVDVSVGSVARALFEANASVVLWVQWLILRVLQTTRASTSSGTDLDSWMADFSLVRLSASPSSGTVSFSRFTPTLPASVPVGTLLKTADGSLGFAVTADPTISIWQASSTGYLIPGGVASANLPVTCLASGQAGNVLAGSKSIIASSLPGVDQVTNASGFTNGLDAESDAALRTRFRLFIAGLSRATLASVESAVAGVQQGLHVCIRENIAADGTARPGSFLVTIDDGSGYPSASLLSSVATAIDLVRPVGTMFTVQPPQVILVNATLTAATELAGTAAQSLMVSIQQNITTYLNGLPIGRAASVTRVAQCAYAAGPDVENIAGILLNGVAADVAPTITGVIKAGAIQVTQNDG